MSKIKEKAKELVDNGVVKTSFTVETVYAYIKKGDTVEIEDNREKFKTLFHPKKLGTE